MSTFASLLHFSLLSVYLGVVLFGTYFPFSARKFESRGCFRYIHSDMVVLVIAVLFSSVLVGVQLALGGYRRRMVPIFCLTEANSAFWSAIVPPCFIAAIFLTLVMVLFFKIIDREEWHCMKMKVSA